jgi:hypothetical protein
MNYFLEVEHRHMLLHANHVVLFIICLSSRIIIRRKILTILLAYVDIFFLYFLHVTLDLGYVAVVHL